MDTTLEILDKQHVDQRAELVRALEHVTELVGEAGLRADLGREPFDINLTVDDLLAAAEDAKHQLVEHLIGPIDQPPPSKFDPNPRMPVMPERPPDPEDPA